MKKITKNEKAFMFSLYMFNPVEVVGGMFQPKPESKNSQGQTILTPSILADCWEGTFQFENFKLQLKKIENISIEDLEDIFQTIGGTPHLSFLGVEDLKQGLLSGDWAEAGFQLDYFTLERMLSSLRVLGYDLDEMIFHEFANEVK